MRVETNERLVKRNRRLAQYLFFGSFGLLILGLFAANAQLANLEGPEVPLIATVLPSLVLPAAFAMTIFSVRMTNLWMRQPRPENAIRENLKGISQKSVLYNYYHFPARHVLICPQGVFAMITRFQEGKFTVNGERWSSQRSPLGRILGFMRQDGIGDPNDDARRAAEHVRRQLEPFVPGVTVQPLILFTDPRVRVETHDPTVPVLHVLPKLGMPTLKDYLRDLGKTEAADEELQVAGRGRSAKAAKAKPVARDTMPTPDQIEAFEAATLSR